MNQASKDKDLQIRIDARHSFLKTAKKFLKRDDRIGFEFFIELAEREQLGIEKIQGKLPYKQD